MTKSDDSRGRAPTDTAGQPAKTAVSLRRVSLRPIEDSASLLKPNPNRFGEQALIGEGGLGAIYLAFDRLMMRDVAMKTLREELWGDDDAKRHFIEEAQITGQLDHPNIVPVHGLMASHDGVAPSMIMKFVDGETYSQIIQRLHESPSDAGLREALQVFLKVCDAIAFAHERGVVHCDLKPDNIMVGTHGQVYVMDWGVALLEGGQLPPGDGASRVFGSRRVRIGGTLGFMAPEQLENDLDAIDETTDVYGLGGLLCVLLTGQAPRHRAPNDLEDWYAAPDIESRKALPAVPPELCRTTERALSPRKEDRIQSAEELKREVEGFMAGGGWFDTRRYLKGDIIIREGDRDAEAFIITSGTCEVFKNTPGGDGRLIRSMGPGDAFGELSILTKKPRSATVVAKTDVSLRRITQTALDRELERNPVLASFMSAVARRFADLEARLEGQSGEDD